MGDLGAAHARWMVILSLFTVRAKFPPPLAITADIAAELR
jgi:hypothetical protein